MTRCVIRHSVRRQGPESKLVRQSCPTRNQSFLIQLTQFWPKIRQKVLIVLRRSEEQHLTSSFHLRLQDLMPTNVRACFIHTFKAISLPLNYSDFRPIHLNTNVTSVAKCSRDHPRYQRIY